MLPRAPEEWGELVSATSDGGGKWSLSYSTRLSTDDIESAALRFIVKTGGYAATRIANRLTKSGGRLVMPPEGFFVEGTEGPLKKGELERATDWARHVAAAR